MALVVASVPWMVETDYALLLYNVMALNALVVLGLNLLIGCAGQVSFGHAAFYGMGAYFSAIASTTWQWPLGGAVALALAVTGVVGFLLALPVLRLEGHYLVMATLGFNVIVTILLNQLEEWTGGPSGLPGIAPLEVFSFVIDSDRKFYFFVWGVFLAMFALTLNLQDSSVGRALYAIHERDLTARVLGVPVYRYKVTVFVLSALYAGLAGVLYAHYVTFISPRSFDIFYSVQVVTMVVVGGMGSLWGGVMGTALVTCLPELLHHFQDYHVLLYGLILVSVLVFCPQGLAPLFASLAGFLGKALFRRREAEERCRAETEDAPERPGSLASGEKGAVVRLPSSEKASAVDAPPLLLLKEVSVHFGGLQALDRVDMRVFPGEIVGLIGPNGAGKTTLLNAVSGIVRPQTGDILLNEASLRSLAPHEIAARGVGRTFQTVQVFLGWSVLENVLLGYHCRSRAGFSGGFLHGPGERREESEFREEGLRMLQGLGLAEKACWPASRLSLMEQKLLELARAMALGPSVLLLDEPVGGLNPRESLQLVGAVSRLREQGMGIVLVEHDMNVVMGLSDRVVVLRNGHPIAEGKPREVQKNAEVIAAYLGTGRGKGLGGG